MKILSDLLAVLCFIAIMAVIFRPTDLRRRRSARAIEALDVEAFLAAIRAVESGGNPYAVGRHGELSAYQFTETTWRQHTETPFTWAQSAQFADKIAKAHLGWLSGKLIHNSREVTPLTLARAWRHGLGFPASKTSGDYELRVLNLYQEARKKCEQP